MQRRIKALLLTIFSTLLCLVIAVAVDRLVGLANPSAGICNRPLSSLEFHTPEFHYTAKHNKWGFRGNEQTLECRGGPKIMLLGDSFTWGWGVDYEKTWAAWLDNLLKRCGINACVFNLL